MTRRPHRNTRPICTSDSTTRLETTSVTGSTDIGAAGARIVATGRRDGEVLILIFPYADGWFRDTFTRHPAAGTWSLLIESQAKDRSWSTFASYELKREK